MILLQSSNALHHKVVARQSPGLVEATDVHLSSEWNAERLRAEHIYHANKW